MNKAIIIFSGVFQPEKGRDLRGVGLGISTDELVQMEGPDHYEETQIMPHFQYYFPMPDLPFGEFEVVYYYGRQRNVISISLFLAYNPQLSALKRETFEALAEHTLDFFRERYGEYKLIKEKNEAGIHQEYSWRSPSSAPDKEIFLLIYDEMIDGNERVLKVEFQWADEKKGK